MLKMQCGCAVRRPGFAVWRESRAAIMDSDTWPSRGEIHASWSCFDLSSQSSPSRQQPSPPGMRPPLDAGTYNQWKQALKSTTATPAGEIRALPGFRVELVRPALPGEGSWVALAFDPKGRPVISREDKGLLRLTMPAKPGDPIAGGDDRRHAARSARPACLRTIRFTPMPTTPARW